MGRRKGDPTLVKRLWTQLHEIFVAKREKNPSGIVSEAFGEDNDLLNFSSRVNAGEELTPEQRAKIEEIWKRETSPISRSP